MTADPATPARPIVVYSTTWCGHCKRLLRQLDEAQISYQVVDLDEHPQHGDKIEAKTGGYRTVPTLEVGGDLLVNPSIVEVRAALA